MNILNLFENIIRFPTEIVDQTKVMSKTEHFAIIQINIHFLGPTMFNLAFQTFLSKIKHEI
jgi:hypothetical protein